MTKTKPKTLARRIADLEVDLSVAYARIADLQADPALRLLTALTEAIGDTPSSAAMSKIRKRIYALEVEAAAHLKVFAEVDRRIQAVKGASLADQDQIAALFDETSRAFRRVEALTRRVVKLEKRPAAKKRSRGRK